MRLDISEDRLAELFPAFLIVDRVGSILTLGPSLARQMPELTQGAKLAEHFAFADPVAYSDFPQLALTGTLLELKSFDDRIHLSGSLLAVEANYLLAVRHLPPRFSLKANMLQMSDFGPDDPSVPGMLLVGLQQAMIEDSREVALELGRERQKSAELFDRFSRIAGYMAHDFNNLLSIIQLNADRITITSGSDPRNRRLAEIIAESAGRCAEVCRSLMTLSHQRQDSRVLLEPDKLVRDNSEFFQTIVGTKIRIEYSLNTKGRMVKVSRIGLLNSLINLIVNARDAMAEGGLLKISTGLGGSVKELPSDHITFDISDSGHGMSDDVLANAFKPLFSSKRTGNGMGLASVLEFVKEMGGEVWLDSKPGRGTSCHMYLPEAFLPADKNVIAATTARSVRGMVDPGPSRIILVEDEPYALEALAELLGLRGYEVVPCANAEEARSALAAGKFQLLISDVVLCDGSGIMLANEACKITSDMRVILMSGYVPMFETMQADWQFVRKPLNFSLLCDMAASALNPFPTGPEVR